MLGESQKLDSLAAEKEELVGENKKSTDNGQIVQGVMSHLIFLEKILIKLLNLKVILIFLK